MKFIKYGAKFLPKKAHKHDAGYDCFTEDLTLKKGSNIINLRFGIKLKKNEFAFVTMRSSAIEYGIIPLIVPIDYGYTGSVHALVYADKDIVVDSNKVFQLVVCKTRRCLFGNREKRKLGAFGSTGINWDSKAR